MDKHEFLRILADDGIEAEIIEGVVMMTVSEEDYHKPTKMKRYVRRTGFDGSWGMRTKASGEQALCEAEKGEEQGDKGQRYVVHRRRHKRQLLAGETVKDKDPKGQGRRGKRGKAD